MDDPKEKIIPITPAPSPAISPETLAALAALLAAPPASAAGPAADQAKPGDAPAAEANTSMAAIQAGATLGKDLLPLAAPILRRSAHRLASRKFWVVVSALGALLSQNAVGLNLPPLTTLAVAGLTAVWVVVQGMIDAKEDGGNG